MSSNENGSSKVRSLVKKYPKSFFENLPAVTRPSFERKLIQRDVLDQHFAQSSFEFSSGVNARHILDERTRFLVLIGQFTVSKSHSHLEGTLQAALASVPVRDVLESMFQGVIYGGETVLDPALDIFCRVANEAGIVGDLGEGQLPLNGTADSRDLEQERATWLPGADDNGLFDTFAKKYGWLGISTGLRSRGAHHLILLKHLDTLDSEFAQLWERFAYQNLYSRWVLDEKTRTLCTVADLLAIGATTSAREHMRGALTAGASPRELLEIVFLSGVYFGFPLMTNSLRALEDLLKEMGRIDELGNPEPHPYDVAKNS